MLRCACNDVVSLLSTSVGDSFNSKVVGFSCTTGEDNFLYGTSEQVSDLMARFLYRVVRCGTKRMCTGGVAKCVVRYGIMASNTSGAIGVVAWLSM